MRATTTLLAPIILDAFERVVSPIFQRAVFAGHGSGTRPSIALAVSGGVDSMALALLCSRYQQQYPDACTFHAYVVDHKARPESTHEARTVVENVSRLGLQIKVLELQWPTNDKQPLEQPNFEGLAREMRYDVLGREMALRKHHALLTAHHQDDQAETVMMRLVSGYTGFGLRAIKRSSPFPCNYGRYYVHQGSSPPQRVIYRLTSGEREAVTVAGKGLSVHRPLLSFTKKDLTDTCLEAGAPWVEDSTNVDRTATLRNTVRHLLATDVLPHALRKPSLIRVGTHVASTYYSKYQKAETLLKSIRYEAMDLTVGTAYVVLDPMVRSDNTPEWRRHRSMPRSQVLAIRELVQMLSPNDDVDIARAENLFDRLVVNMVREDFTKAGLLFQRVGKMKGKTKYMTTGHISAWRISRQPRSRNRQVKYPTHSYVCPNDGSFSDWQLIDGRWWLRVAADKPETIFVRQLQDADMASLVANFDSAEKFTQLRDLLKSKAPGMTRFTIPVLATSEDYNSTVLAIPTLGVLTKAGAGCGIRSEFQWKHTAGLEVIREHL